MLDRKCGVNRHGCQALQSKLNSSGGACTFEVFALIPGPLHYPLALVQLLADPQAPQERCHSCLVPGAGDSVSSKLRAPLTKSPNKFHLDSTDSVKYCLPRPLSSSDLCCWCLASKAATRQKGRQYKGRCLPCSRASERRERRVQLTLLHARVARSLFVSQSFELDSCQVQAGPEADQVRSGTSFLPQKARVQHLDLLKACSSGLQVNAQEIGCNYLPLRDCL